MSQVDLSSYKLLYVKSAREHLEKIRAGLANGATPDPEIINDIYINIHSLGSQNLAMNYASTGTLCRVIENFFYKVKNGEEVLTDARVQFINDSLLKVEDSISSVESSDH